MTQTDLEKKNAGERAADFVSNGMTIGLGSGTTVYWMLKQLSKRFQYGLKITGIPSSKKTEQWAKEFGIRLTSFAAIDKLDLTIDGANEIDPFFNLMKGGGGSLVREKILANISKEFIIIADQAKLHSQLGSIPLPVEIIPFGWEVTSKQIEKLGCTAALRKKKNHPFNSDNGNFIVDCHFDTISDPELLHQELIMIPGVIETGLFINMTDKIIIGKNQIVEVIENNRK